MDDADFNVLNHCDCWTNNIMFQYGEAGQLLDTYFVDLAMPKYGSPAQDLIYFILSSLQADIKIKQFDHLIQYYHENLVENLELLKYPKAKPTLKELHILLHKYRIWGKLFKKKRKKLRNSYFIIFFTSRLLHNGWCLGCCPVGFFRNVHV